MAQTIIDKTVKYFRNSTQIKSVGAGIAAGISAGGAVALRIGTARDAIGLTMFTSYSLIHPGNQDLDGSSDPKLIIGGEAGGNISFQHSDEPIFLNAFNSLSPSMSTVSGSFGVGGAVSVGGGNFSGSFGYGIGETFKYGNQNELKESYSVSFAEDYKIIDKYAPSNYTKMRVINLHPVLDKAGSITGYVGTLQVLRNPAAQNIGTFGEHAGPAGDPTWQTTNIQMKSGVQKGSDDKKHRTNFCKVILHSSSQKSARKLNDK